MTRIALLVLLVLTGTASARVVMTPAIPRQCRELESWDKVMTCVKRFGEAKVAKELPGAKLIAVTKPNFRVPGLYLYREKGKHWVIAGMFEANGTFEVFSLSKPTIAKHIGYRIDVGIVEDSSGEGSKSIIQQKISVFCSGESYFCSDVMTSCDYLVDGRARESFRGKLTIKNDTVKVTGDSSRSGTMCVAGSEIQLDFAAMARSRAATDIGDPLF
jgi:hypothetical protein